MFDFFGTERRIREMKDVQERQEKLRDMAYETVRNSTEFAYKIMGKKGTKDYWEWRCFKL